MIDLDSEYEQKYEMIIKGKILELFKDTNARIFLFGSRARKDFKRGADIDIGVEGIEAETFQKLMVQFNEFWEESIVPCKVDLVNFDKVTPEFKSEAKKEIVVWKTG